ncbi:MAG: PAS domain S-box protein [Acidobacteriaceae bacterium]|nr:PAS domain S-box protein [Acidobacteriaceae bacterium]
MSRTVGKVSGNSAAFLLTAIVDSSDDAIISEDLNGVVTSWNKSAERLFGYTASEAIGRTIAELLIPQDSQDEELDVSARLRRGEHVDHFETVRRCKDGALVDVALTMSPVKDDTGNVVGASKIARNISDRKRTERSSLLLSAIVDSSDDAIISKDLNGVITSWNKSAQRLFGYTPDEAIGKTVAELLIPQDRQEEEPNILARLRRGERVDHFETIRRRKDGGLLDISLTISPVKDSAGTIVGASKIARDITDAKRIRSALVESEARFRQLADAMPQMVWTARPDGYIDYYNERWYEFTGFSREVFGDASWVTAIHPEDMRATLEAYYTAIRSGQPYNFEHRLWDRSEERWRWFIGRALPIFDHSGRISKWFGTSTDIDPQKHVEDDLRRANEALEQFAFSASHDLQEPLRAIKIYGELLAKRHAEKLDPQALDYIRFLRDGAVRMEALVRDLLTYTEALKYDRSVEIADANAALRAALDNLSSAISESAAQVTADRLPSVPVSPTHLQQLFQNLVGNAVKYRSPERIPTVRITAERQNGDWIFAVSDNGIGIDPQYKEHIFGLFKRLHTKNEYAGTGIGLAICRRIVDQYRGRIWVDSAPGQGSTFRFSLPE